MLLFALLFIVSLMLLLATALTKGRFRSTAFNGVAKAIGVLVWGYFTFRFGSVWVKHSESWTGPIVAAAAVISLAIYVMAASRERAV